MTRPYDFKSDPLFRPLSAKVMPASTRCSLGGKVMTEKQALMSARRTKRPSHKGPMRRDGGGK